ncbi:MAG: hypothetical protein JW821_03610 [Deltaproteobacteria bacterium]|nr:hypothetical protein [Deltaproteobacteria bacterium]
MNVPPRLYYNPSIRPFLIAFFLLHLLLSAFFADTWITPNPGSRALPVRALFEEGTLRIDTYADLTMDKARIGGHFNAKKAPLTLALSAYYLGGEGEKGPPA